MGITIDCTKVLLVEDNPGNRELLKMAFRDIGSPIELIYAGDVDELMQHLKPSLDDYDCCHPYPAIIVLDYFLPKQHGLEILQQLKGNERLKDIPVFVLSGSVNQKMQLQTMQHGAVELLSKPAQYDDILELSDYLCKWVSMNCYRTSLSQRVE